MFGLSVEVFTRNILSWSMEDQTHSGMPRGAQISLALTVAN